MTNIVWKRVLGAAKMVVGVAFVYEGFKFFQGEPGVALLGRDGLQGLGYAEAPHALKQASGGAILAPAEYKPGAERSRLDWAALPVPKHIVNKSPVFVVRDIDARVAYIQGLVDKGSVSPRVKEVVADVLGKKCKGGTVWCVKPKSHKDEIVALFKAVTDPRSPYALRYTRDNNKVDQFHSADNLLDLHIGDCDDSVILLGSMLRSAGHPVSARVIQAKGAPSWSHIYLVVGTPPGNPTQQIVLDPTVEQLAGWEVPKGYIEKQRDFPL